MTTYKHECGCVLTRVGKGMTMTFELTQACDEHGGLLSFGEGAPRADTPQRVRRSNADVLRQMFEDANIVELPLPAPPYDISKFGTPPDHIPMPTNSRMAELMLKLGWQWLESNDPARLKKSQGHTLCDEQVDYLNLLLTRERVELLLERRRLMNDRKKDPARWANRVPELDGEVKMLDSITKILRRQ